MTETQIQKSIIDALSKLPYVCVWRNSNAMKGKYKYGLHSRLHPTGSSDIIAVVHPHGRMVAIEVKTKEDFKWDERVHRQADFMAAVSGYGGEAGFAWDVPSALEIVERARKSRDDSETTE